MKNVKCKRFFAVALALAVTAGLFAGCGSSGDNTQTSSATGITSLITGSPTAR